MLAQQFYKAIRRPVSSCTLPLGKSCKRRFSIAPVHLLRFPQWQGSGDLRNFQGCQSVGDIVAEVLQPPSQSSVTVSLESATQNGSAETKVLHLQSLVSQASQAHSSLDASGCDRLFTVGGDCGVEVPSISYLNALWPNLAVVWFDAHADLNSPASSPSGNFHGMPVRTLLGEGPEDLMRTLASTLRPNQVFYAGLRDIDPLEQAHILGHNIFSMEKPDWQQLCDKLQGFSHVYLHVDLDVLDPNEFPFVTCPTKGGLRSEELVQGIEQVAQALPVVGCGITECTGDLDLHAEDVLFFIVETLVKALKKPVD